MTDPALGEAARAGTLNEDSVGGALAVPFVYHDPSRSQFALVVPEALRHRALEERSALWDRVAAETECAVPRYVLACPVVIGARGLCAFLGLPEPLGWQAPHAPVTPSWGSVSSGEGGLAIAESRLLAREEKLRRWADELHGWEERLLDRERALETKAQMARAILDGQPLSSLSSEATYVRDEELGALEELEELEWTDDLTGVTGVTGVRMAEPLSTSRDVARGPSSGAEPRSGDAEQRLRGLSVPAALASASSRALVPLLDQDGLLLFLRIDQAARSALRAGPPELLVQLIGADTVPGALLTLAARDPASQWAQRLVLDVRDPTDRAALEILAERFEALLVPVVDGEMTTPVLLSAPREGNAALLLERLDRAAFAGHALKTSPASSRPPTRLDGAHPFALSGAAASAREALDRVQLLAAWATPLRLEMALLVLCIPTEQVEETFYTVVEDARAHGIALPPAVFEEASARGVVTDARALVRGSLASFASLTRAADRGGLSSEEVALNWAALLDFARTQGLDEDVHPGGRLPAWSSDRLEDLLAHPDRRVEAAIELLSRRDPAHLPAVFDAVRKMTRDEVLTIVPRLVPFGEAATAVLVAGLGARKTFVRQAAALTLARLGSPRALEALVQMVLNEPSAAWREIARVLPRFGSAAVEALVRAAETVRGEDERLIFAFAHLAEQGQRALLEAVVDSETGRGSALALRGLEERGLARTHLAQLAEEAPVTHEEREVRFSSQLERAFEGGADPSMRPSDPVLRPV